MFSGQHSSLKLSTWWFTVRDTLKYYVSGIWQQMNEKLIFTWAQAIAFKVLIAIVPMLILVTGILGLLLRGQRPFATVERYVREFLPPYESDRIIEFLFNLQNAGSAITFIGSIGLLLTAMTLFTTLRVVIANVFQEEWHENRSILRGYIFDLRMVLQVGMFFILSLITSLAMQTYTIDFGLLKGVGLNPTVLEAGWDRALRLVGLVVPFLLTLAMFFQLYYFIPKPHPPKRCALLGTTVTALLWEGAKYGFTLYASHVSRFGRYSSGSSDSSFAGLGDVFGLIIAFVFWAYFSGLVLIVGAIVAMLSEKHYRNRRRIEQARQARKKLQAQREQHTAGLPDANGAADAPADADEEESSRQNLPLT